MFEKLNAFVDSFLEMGTPGYDLLVYQNGQCIYRRTRGLSDVENQIPMNGEERYNIYSCSKLITVTAAMQLWEKGLFSLEDRLSDYLSEFAEMTVQTDNGIQKAKNPILIRHLFQMTAGFSYNVASPQLQLAAKETDSRCPTLETMRYLAREPLLFEPGTSWRYSLCHDVLAALVEKLSGQRFGNYVKEHIFDVLGMTHSTFCLPESELDTIAAQYRIHPETGLRYNCGKNIMFYKLGSEYESGGAGGISTAEDYMKFLEGLRTHKLLHPDTLRLMIEDSLEGPARVAADVNLRGYGLGLRCPRKENPGRLTDFGWGGAAGAVVGVDIPRNMCYLYMQHVLNSPVQSRKLQIYDHIIDALDGVETEIDCNTSQGPVEVLTQR